MSLDRSLEAIRRTEALPRPAATAAAGCPQCGSGRVRMRLLEDRLECEGCGFGWR